MQGIRRAVTRLITARAFFAGAAILAGVATPRPSLPAFEDVALAQPRVQPHGHGGVALLHPLPPSDALRIRRIFSQQSRADISAAVAETAEVGNPMLLGHILADRYLGASAPLSRPTEQELRSWLTRFADLLDAPALHALLGSTVAKGVALPAFPTPPRVLPTPTPPMDVDPASYILPRNPVLDRSVHEPARAGRADRAVRLIARTRGIDALYGALLRAEVAQILFTQGRDAEALTLAEAAHHQTRGRIGLAPYIAGLAAWRLERTELARTHFEAAHAAPLTTTGRRAAAAFWAARAHLRRSNARSYAPWMQRATEHPRTFYGLLARRALGQATVTPEPTANWTLGEADVDAIAALPGGVRAFALLQVGEPERAEAELRRIWAEMAEKPGYSRAIMLVAREAGLKDLAAQVASVILPVDALDMPLPASRLRPRGGFRMDPALVYAVTRTESNFHTGAVSRAGARGLMQLMPETAAFVVKSAELPRRTAQSNDPGTNLDLGQRYMVQLSQFESIQSDLIRLLAGYNAGPTSAARWGAELRHMGDPLLFLESVPLEETRAYIPKVLTYTWLYAARMGLPSPSLDELAAGTWPRFHAGAPRRDGMLVH